MVLTPYPPSTQSSCYPYIPWRVFIMRWIRCWTSASQFLNSFPQQCRYFSYITKSLGWLWVYRVFTETCLWYPYLTWCLKILCLCQGALFLKLQKNAAPSTWLLKLYIVLKAPKLHFSSGFSEFLIHRPSILYLRFWWYNIACFTGSSSPDSWYDVVWRSKPAPGLLFHIISQCDSTKACVIGGYYRRIFFTSVVIWTISLTVTIRNYALNANVDTASSNYW